MNYRNIRAFLLICITSTLVLNSQVGYSMPYCHESSQPLAAEADGYRIDDHSHHLGSPKRTSLDNLASVDPGTSKSSKIKDCCHCQLVCKSFVGTSSQSLSHIGPNFFFFTASHNSQINPALPPPFRPPIFS